MVRYTECSCGHRIFITGKINRCTKCLSLWSDGKVLRNLTDDVKPKLDSDLIDKKRNIERMIADYKQGIQTQELSIKYKISPSQIWTIMSNAGVSRKRGRNVMRFEYFCTMVEFYLGRHEGRSASEMALELGVKYSNAIANQRQCLEPLFRNRPELFDATMEERYDAYLTR